MESANGKVKGYPIALLSLCTDQRVQRNLRPDSNWTNSGGKKKNRTQLSIDIEGRDITAMSVTNQSSMKDRDNRRRYQDGQA